MSRITCEDCPQCSRLTQRDGGPTHREIANLHLDASVVKPTAAFTSLTPENAEDQKLIMTPVQINDVVKLQREGDHDLALIYKCVKEGTTLSHDVMKNGSTELKKWHDRISSMRINDHECLEIRYIQNNRSVWVTACPETCRETLIRKTHTQIHSGVRKTIARLRLSWYWPGMTAGIRRAVLSCEICQAAKTSKIKQSKNQVRLHSGRPWSHVSIDLVGPLNETSRGNKWNLVLVDHFTRFSDAVAIPTARAADVAEALDKVFSYFGLPESIGSDQGAQFESELFQELCNMWRVTKKRTTPFHPSANGTCERGNHVIGNSLRALLLSQCAHEDDWDTLLPHIMRFIRAVPHSKTGETPNMMMMGRETKLPDNLVHPLPPQKPVPKTEYVVQLQDRLDQLHKTLRAQQLQVRNDDDSEPCFYKEGDEETNSTSSPSL
jgi:transposase InsO family protein